MNEALARRTSLGLIFVASVLLVLVLAFSTGASRHPPTSAIVVGRPIGSEAVGALDTIDRLIARHATHVATAPTIGNVVAIALALVWMGTGALIVSRQGRNLAGWIFVSIGFGWICEAFGGAITTWALYGAHPLPAQGLFALMGEASLLPILLLPLLFLLFPDGRPPERWRWLEWAIVVAIGLILVGYVLGPGPLNNFVDAGILYMNPVGIASLGDAASTLTAAGVITMLLGALATVFALRSRYKRSTGEARQQLRWLVAVATTAGLLLSLGIVVTMLGGIVSGNVDNGPPIFPIVLVLFALTVTLGVPAAYLVAIFRYRLWDLDVVIRKAVIALVLAVLIAIVVLLPVVLASQVALWGGTPRPLVIAIGVALGLLVVPLLRLARRLADRFVFGKRATPYEVLTEFSSRIGETYAADEVVARMAHVLGTATGATRARVLLRVGHDLREEASLGEGDGEETQVPVSFQGSELGALAVMLPANDPMDPSKERLVTDLAAQAGPVLHNVRLIEELRASRQRLVAAQDEERRKLERDIHDGVQQQLVALAVKLRLADTMVDRDPAKAHAALAGLQADAAAALEDLRDLAHGIYPPLLADQGLAAALQAQARRAAVPTTVEADGIGRHPRDVEAAVYFCALEALNNVAKYAGASRATIALRQTDGRLTFTVRDDGMGFDRSSVEAGAGLQGMADRLDAIGGSFAIDSAPGAGTTVTGSAPTAPAAG
jgi:signal transduction histidine kinase